MALPSKRDIQDSRYWNRRLRADPMPSFSMIEEEPNRLVPQRFAMFELKTNLAPGGTADAYFMLCTDGTSYVTDTSGTTKVVDRLGTFSGVGRDTTGTSGGAHGDYCIAMHDDFVGSDTQADDLWIVIAIGSYILRPFILTQDVWPSCIDAGGVAADVSASVKWVDTNTTGTVYLSDAGSHFGDVNQWGIGRGAADPTTLVTATTGFAACDPNGKWFVVSGSFSCFAAGVTYGPISNNAVGLVQVWWTDIATGSATLVDSTKKVEALNWIPNAAIGGGVSCAIQYIPGERRWYILAPGVGPCKV